MVRYRKSPRLVEFDYAGTNGYFVTLVTAQRLPAFRSSAHADLVLKALQTSAIKHRFGIPAYCFMPDHLHLLAVGQRPESNLKEFAHHFKTVSGFRYKRLTGRHLWQISYHDRVLRREEDLEAVADYIWCNPVRAGLAPDAASYAFSNAPR